MIVKLKHPLIVLLLVCAFSLTTTKTARADIGYTSDGKAIGVIVAVVAVGALVVVGVYFAVHHGHSLKGCTSSGPGGMQMLNQGDQQTYALTGNLDGIETGDRVRVSGKKRKGGGKREFEVTKLSKDFGACHVLPATP